jgi:rRNA maturation endonuclease Nob1
MQDNYQLEKKSESELICPRCREVIKDLEQKRCHKCGTFLLEEEFLLYNKDLYPN